MNIFDGIGFIFGQPKLVPEHPKQIGESILFSDQVIDESDSVDADETSLKGANIELIGKQAEAFTVEGPGSLGTELLQGFGESRQPPSDTIQLASTPEHRLDDAIAVEVEADDVEELAQVALPLVKQPSEPKVIAESPLAVAFSQTTETASSKDEPAVDSPKAKGLVTDPKLLVQPPRVFPQNIAVSDFTSLERGGHAAVKEVVAAKAEPVTDMRLPVLSAPLSGVGSDVKQQASSAVPHGVSGSVPMEPQRPQTEIKPFAATPNSGLGKIDIAPTNTTGPDVSSKLAQKPSVEPKVSERPEVFLAGKGMVLPSQPVVEADIPVDVGRYFEGQETLIPRRAPKYGLPGQQDSERVKQASVASADAPQQVLAASEMERPAFSEGFEGQPTNIKIVGGESVKEQFVQPLTVLKPAEVARQVAMQIQEAGQAGESKQIEIRLNPEELGKVKISLAAQDIGGSVSIIVERPETLDLMRRHTDQLMRELRNAGWSTVDLSMEQQPFGSTFSSADQQGTGRESQPDQAHTSDLLLDVMPPPSEPAGDTSILVHDRLDLRI